jgi:type IV pilus assembly protein PilF
MFPFLLASRNRSRFVLRALGFAALFALAACATTSKDGQHPLDGNPSKSPRERAQILIEASNGSLMEGDPIGALQFLTQAEKLDPQYAPIYHAKALSYAYRKDFTSALREMKKSIDLDPENPYALNTYGKFLLDAGRLDEAEAPLIKSGDNPTFRESFKANTNLGILYYRKNQPDRADQRFQKAINDDPVNSCIAYYYRGHLLVRKNQLAEAEKYYERATQKQCAAFADAHLAVGMMDERLGKKDEARKKYLEIRQNFPESKASETAMERLKKIQ